jgi:hypothetical protein
MLHPQVMALLKVWDKDENGSLDKEVRVWTLCCNPNSCAWAVTRCRNNASR